jgi:hypothetical protein
MHTTQELFRLNDNSLTVEAFLALPIIDVDWRLPHGALIGHPRRDRGGTEDFSAGEKRSMLDTSISGVLHASHDIREFAHRKICVEMSYCDHAERHAENIAYFVADAEGLASIIALPGATTLAVWGVKKRLLDRFCGCTKRDGEDAGEALIYAAQKRVRT